MKKEKENIKLNEKDSNLIKLKFLGVGWKSKIILKRTTSYVSINKLIVNGCALKKGEELASCLVEDQNGEKMILTYLQGNKNTNKFKV